MKKLLKSLLVAFVLISFALTINIAITHAQTPLDVLQDVGEGTNLPDFNENSAQHADAPADFIEPGVGSLTSPILFALDFFKLVISSIAFVIVIISAIKLVSVSSEDEATKQKNRLIMAVVGLFMIQLADVMVTRVFFGDQGEAFEDIASAQLFAEEGQAQFRGIVGFIEAFLGAGAVFVIVTRGILIMVGAGNEESINKAKSQILYSLIGLMIVGLAELLIRGVIFPDNGNSLPDVNTGRQVFAMLTNFVAGFIAIASFASLFYGGYRYVVSVGNEEETARVKRIFISSLIALILSLGSFALVNTLVQFEDPIDSADARQGEEALPISN